MTAGVSIDRIAHALRLLDAEDGGVADDERRETVRQVALCAVRSADDPASRYAQLAERFPLGDYLDEAEATDGAPAPAPVRGAGAMDDALVKAFSEALGVPADAIDERRLLELAREWMQFTLAVDAAVRTIWREISKHASSEALSSAPAPAAIRTVSASFLKGGGAGSEEARRQLDLLRRLISGMLMGLADAAKQHAQRHARIFSPDAIRSTQPGKRTPSREAAYWNQYEQLVEAHHAADVQAIFGTIQGRLAEYVIETLNASSEGRRS